MYKKVKQKVRKLIVDTLNHFYRFRDFCIYHSGILKRPKYDKRFNIAICAIFKDEARFLREWIEYHSMIGVEHFYLYNNNSSDNYIEVLEQYIKSGLVSLYDWPYDQAQMKAYKDFYERHSAEAQWVSFLDIDEFFVPKDDFSLLDWIKKNDRYPVLQVYWKMFGSSSLLEHDDNKLCIEQYVNSWDALINVGKCLINTDYQIALFNSGTHHATLTKLRNKSFPFKFHPVDQFGHINIFDKEKKLRKSKSDKAQIQINHYWSKGWDVYNNKRSWQGDVFFKENPKKNINYFIEHEINNTSVDYSIYRYLLILKWKLLNSKEYEELINCKLSKQI